MARLTMIVLSVCAADFAFNGSLDPLTIAAMLIACLTYYMTEEDQ